jgi:hypothetical protein
MEYLGHMKVLFLIFLRNLHTDFHSGWTNVHSYQHCTRVLSFPQPPSLAIFVGFGFLDYQEGGIKSQCHLICISLVVKDIEFFFHIYIDHFSTSFEKCPVNLPIS